MKRPSKQPAVPAAFTTSLTHTEFSPTWHITGDVDPATFTMNMEAAYSSKTLATTPLKCRSHTQKYDLHKVNKTLSRLIHVDKAVKNTTIIVIYKVLVYIQMSQPTTCFGLF